MSDLVLIKLLVLVIHFISCKSTSTMEGIKLAELTSCTCRGFTAVYECTVMGGLVTIWRGNAINCENSAAGMLLLHNRFGTSDRDYTKTCNNGTISGRGARVSGVFYTSQLRVNISLDLIGKTIECASFNNSSQSIIINATTTPYPSPKQPSLSLVDLELRQTSFTWSPVAPDCPAIHYNILASNCGSCPTTTNHTNVTCTEIPFEQNGEICALSLQTVVCGNVTGNMSDAARGLFRAITVEVNSGSTGAIASASILAIILLASVFVFTAIMIILIRANKRARLTESARRRAMLSATNSRYQEVEHRTSRASIAINKNVAYAKSPVSTDSSHCQTEPHVIERVYAEIS